MKRSQTPYLSLYRIPRTSFIWLLAAVVGVILPHVGRMPFWLTGLCALAVLGRILIYQGKMSYPGQLLKAGLVFVTLAAMALQFGSKILALDAMVNILIVGIALKLLEMHRKRDVLLVIYLCYFTLVAEFIYSQSIPVAVYLMLCVVLITSALLSLHQQQEHQRPLRTFKIAAQILIQSLPIMLALFLLFPRISPMWSVASSSNSALSGLSANMTPGDIGELISSPDVAFRVQFESSIPANKELYWRAISLDQFDGRSWGRGYNMSSQSLRENPRDTQDWFQNIEYSSEPVVYNVIMEPTNQHWVYTLKVPQFTDERFYMRSDYQVEARREVTQRMSYDARSYLDNRLESKLSKLSRRRNLALPENNQNQRSRAFAQQLRQQMGSDEAYVQALLSHFREQQFFYTLSPSLLGENSIDEFLFETMAGFCEHYSSAFTFLVRAAGIPARVVTGYQGGELNPFDNTLTVRQYDAHAWSEVWFEGQGWVRVDPTAAVAPERIELGSQIALQTEENFLSKVGFSMLRFRDSLLINNLRFRLEMLDYRWNRFVINYDENMQLEFFSQLFGNVTSKKITFAVFGFIATCTALMGLLLLRKNRKKISDPATRLYLAYCKVLEKRGYSRAPSETPDQYYQRVSLLQPQQQTQMLAITNTYVDIAFKCSSQDNSLSDKISRLKSLVRTFSK